MTKRVSIILDHNENLSITRIAVMFANHLSRNGYQVIINYPTFPRYRFELFQNINYLQLRALLVWVFFKNMFKKKKWIAEKNYPLEKNIKFNNYLYRATKDNIPNADYILIFQNQLLFDIIDFPKEKGEIIDSLFTGNFENDPELGPWFMYQLESGCKRMNVKRFASSTQTRDFYIKYDVRVDRVIHCGVDVSEFKPNDFIEKQFDMLMFCDIKKAKGFDFGVSVIKQLKKKDINIKFHSIGRNVQGLDTSIFDTVYGALPDNEYAAVYRKHLFFLYPSLYDGFPAPPLEAMASGAVCILARVAGVGEYAIDGENCLLCEPGNLDEFVKKIKKVLEDPDLCKKISKNAIVTAQRYTWENSTKNLIELMNEP